MLVHKESDLLERILAECEDDYVGLWSILRQVREAGYAQSDAVTLALLRYLLSTGIIEAGEPDASGGFQVWKTSADDTIARIASQWSKLAKEPDLGDIVWFTTPVRADRQ